jgi:hypothetical protein
MGLLSRILRVREVESFIISFSRSGFYSVEETHQCDISEVDVIEVLCLFYLKTLYMIGDSKVSRFIIQRFSSFACDLQSGGAIHIYLFDTLRNMGTVLDLGFDLHDHLKIAHMKFQPLISDPDAIRHKVVLLQRGSGEKFIETHPAVWQGKIYIPLALFAFVEYCRKRHLLGNGTLGKLCAGCIKALHQQDRFQHFYKTPDFAWLAHYTDGCFLGFQRARIMGN